MLASRVSARFRFVSQVSKESAENIQTRMEQHGLTKGGEQACVDFRVSGAPCSSKKPCQVLYPWQLA